MNTSTGTPSNTNTPTFSAQSDASSSLRRELAELEVVGSIETGGGRTFAHTHDRGEDVGAGGGKSDSVDGISSQLVEGTREDVGDIMERRGMRAKALNQLEEMLEAKVYLWDAAEGKHREKIDYITRMKAVTEILNRTDGLPKRYMEVLQAIAHSNTKPNAPTDAELTPAAAASLRRMLQDFDKKATSGARSEKRGANTTGQAGHK